jgi:hypothetical protein
MCRYDHSDDEEEGEHVRILFLMRHPSYVRLWDNVLRELLSRGSRVHVACELERQHAAWLESLEHEYAGQLFVDSAPLRNDMWAPLLWTLRQTIDYLRFLEPEYAHADNLRARAERGVPRIVIRLMQRGRFRRSRSRHALSRSLLALERAVPALDEITAFIGAGSPDALVVTPLVSQHSQHDYIRSARELGVPSVYGVASWDNLTNKGLVHEKPDRTWVWNEIQCAEAVRYHDLNPESMIACGAHSFDQWFHWKPSWSREEFCAATGIRPGPSIILYVCSSSFVARDEAPIVERWLQALRNSDSPVLRTAGVVVRPHPSTADRWIDDPLEGYENVAVFPLGSESAVERAQDFHNREARSVYFDSIFHATAVVGLNTSALVEAAIVGRRSYTVVTDETRASQEGTLHFAYLRSENGGPLVVAESMTQHIADLARALEEPPPADWNRPFVTDFVRPHGLDRDSAPIVCDDLDAFLAAFAPVRVQRSRVAALLLAPIASWTNWKTTRPSRERVVYGADFRRRYLFKRRRARRRWRLGSTSS